MNLELILLRIIVVLKGQFNASRYIYETLHPAQQKSPAQKNFILSGESGRITVRVIFPENYCAV